MSERRTTRERIDAAAEQRLTRLHSAQLSAATALLDDLLSAAKPYGVDLALFDRFVDLPAACVAVIGARRRRPR
jgi:hypothetical protein